MTFTQILDLAGMFFIPFAIATVPMFIGQQLGIRQVSNQKEMNPVPMESVVTAAFGLLFLYEASDFYRLFKLRIFDLEAEQYVIAIYLIPLLILFLK